ncbi:CdiA C-terminal domain-containing protein [Glycomyces albidus]|uniref:tRNA nuclease CdiA C-terminal domain-containing protein n=1 Tax=Glycomyces albidus TaxID=2656774 RepID=A0A6L5GCN4_9ACTN|nr:hypothetical protein [Glycomyces albidus]MQM27439.1 hypothetical protein [Glycomyces albidus]
MKLLMLLGVGLLMAKPKGGDGPDGPDGDGGEVDPLTGRPKDSEERQERLNFQGKNASTEMAEVHDTAKAEAEQGRPSDSDGDGQPDLQTTDDNRINPSRPADPNNTPRGEPTEVKGNAETKRSLRRENEAAKTLAEQGYDVEQNPPGKENGKNPDYKIEGEYFDCYSPKKDDPGRIRDDISNKVKKDQADRIVLNLDDSGVNLADLRATLERRPIGNLQEIKIVQNGQVVNFYPF